MSRFRAAIALAGIASVGSLCAQTPREGYLISATDLAGALSDPALVVLHVAEDEASYAQAHIPGARFLPYRSVAVEGDGLGAELPAASAIEQLFEGAGVSDTSRVVIYGHTVLASRAFFTLDAAGHARVAMLDGGLAAWQAGGHPVERGPETRKRSPGSFTPRAPADRVVTAEWIRAHAGRIALVDVRPDPEFTGSDGGMGGMHVAGHIDGAKQLPWNALVGPDGRFLPLDQLRAKLTAAGADGRTPVVPYCMVGMRASVVYLVARHLGFDVRLYDGSIVDWGRRGLPTKTGR